MIYDKLKELSLRVEHSEAEDREPIDFDIRDTETDERYATIWGSTPWRDILLDCEHPEHLIEWGDDDEMGECKLCGAQCTWKWSPDGEGGQEREIGQWEKPNETKDPKAIGGIIKLILLDMQKNF